MMQRIIWGSFWALAFLQDHTHAESNEYEINSQIVSFVTSDDNLRIERAKKVAAFGSEAILPLTKALSNSDPLIQRGALYALGEIGPDPGNYAATLVPFLDSGDRMLRLNAAIAIKKLGVFAWPIIPQLISHLPDSDGSVTNQIQLSLLAIGLSAAPALDDVLWLGILPTGIRYRQAQHTLLLLKSPLRWESSKFSEIKGYTTPVPMKFGGIEGRIQGIEGTVQNPIPFTASDLPELLNACKTDITACNPSALGALGSEAKEAIPLLAKLLTNPDLDTRAVSYWALSRIGPPSISVLEKALQDPDLRGQSYAFRALEGIYTAKSISIARSYASEKKISYPTEQELISTIGPLRPD